MSNDWWFINTGLVLMFIGSVFVISAAKKLSPKKYGNICGFTIGVVLIGLGAILITITK